MRWRRGAGLKGYELLPAVAPICCAASAGATPRADAYLAATAATQLEPLRRLIRTAHG